MPEKLRLRKRRASPFLRPWCLFCQSCFHCLSCVIWRKNSSVENFFGWREIPHKTWCFAYDITREQKGRRGFGDFEPLKSTDDLRHLEFIYCFVFLFVCLFVWSVLFFGHNMELVVFV